MVQPIKRHKARMAALRRPQREKKLSEKVTQQSTQPNSGLKCRYFLKCEEQLSTLRKWNLVIKRKPRSVNCFSNDGAVCHSIIVERIWKTKISEVMKCNCLIMTFMGFYNFGFIWKNSTSKIKTETKENLLCRSLFTAYSCVAKRFVSAVSLWVGSSWRLRCSSLSC